MEFVFSGVLAASIASLGPIRRRFYWVFLALHIVMMPAFVFAALLHSWDAWKYSLVGLVLFLGDKLDRGLSMLVQALRPTIRLVSFRELSGGVVALRLQCTNGDLPPSPGTQVKLHVPSVSLFQWHPFTVSETGSSLDATPSPSASTTFTCHIKATGSKRWTDGLLQLARDVAANDPPSLPRIAALWEAGDSGLDETVQPASADAILLLAAGAGITPISALAGQLLVTNNPTTPGTRRGPWEEFVGTVPATSEILGCCATSSDIERSLLPDEKTAEHGAVGGRAGLRVTLVWSVRSMELVLEYLPLLEVLVASPRWTARIHVTSQLAAEDQQR
eukprot:5651698-Prymnesium_polylepis.1